MRDLHPQPRESLGSSIELMALVTLAAAPYRSPQPPSPKYTIIHLPNAYAHIAKHMVPAPLDVAQKQNGLALDICQCVALVLRWENIGRWLLRFELVEKFPPSTRHLLPLHHRSQITAGLVRVVFPSGKRPSAHWQYRNIRPVFRFQLH